MEYACHWKMVKLCLKLGMKIGKIYNIIEFTQKPFVEPFIRKCIAARKASTNTFDKNLFKLYVDFTCLIY